MSTSDHATVMNALEANHGVEESCIPQPPLQGKKLSWYDSFDIKSNKFSGHQGQEDAGLSVILRLAFQSIGVVYGDMGTSPLYVYASTFPNGIKHNDDILGVLSLIIYTVTLISLIKYAKVNLTPSQQVEDGDISNFRLDQLPNNRLKRALRIKSNLEKSRFAKYFLVFAAMLGTSMVIGDGVLTPSISGEIVWISVGILVLLFSVQRFGTDKVGYAFAPIISIWFLLIAGIGIYNFFKFDATVLKALNPKYIVGYFKRNKKDAWISLGGVVLAITGTEAMFADLGHFSVRSNNVDVVYWPMFVVAVFASIIASQAMITGARIRNHPTVPCTRVLSSGENVHTTTKYEGQVYIPEVNYLLIMLACVAITVAFKTTTKIRNAYGIAVVFVMMLTSALLVLVMIMIWKTHILLVILYILIIGSVELLYLSSVLYKFDQGRYLPLVFATFLMVIMFIWNDVHRRKYYYELDHMVSPKEVKEVREIIDNGTLRRVPGLAVFYSELVHGIPPIFKHYVDNVPALHSVLIILSMKSLPISKVPPEERFLFRRVQPNELNVFRCVVRYGYTEARNEHESFERILIERLKEFIRHESLYSAIVEEEKDGALHSVAKALLGIFGNPSQP
ncbi:hypothetical protein C3L33_07589, partial [Rhododendron williamsianum]